MTESPDRLAGILCWRDERYVGRQLTFFYERKRLMLEEGEVTRGLVGNSTPMPGLAAVEGRWKEFSLPYRVFDPDLRRVAHAAITQNKPLAAALVYAKET